MKKIKDLFVSAKTNFIEIWLGLLLFVMLPLVIGIYTDIKGFLASTVITQSIVLILFIYKGNNK